MNDINTPITQMGIWKAYCSLGGRAVDIEVLARGERPILNARTDITTELVVRELRAGKSFNRISIECGASLSTIYRRVKGTEFERQKGKPYRSDVTRELVLRELAAGKDLEEIAVEYNISSHTLRNRLKEKGDK